MHVLQESPRKNRPIGPDEQPMLVAMKAVTINKNSVFDFMCLSSPGVRFQKLGKRTLCRPQSKSHKWFFFNTGGRRTPAFRNWW